MIITADYKFKAKDEKSILELREKIEEITGDSLIVSGLYLKASKSLLGEDELEEMAWVIEELPLKLAEKTSADFDYDGTIDMFDDFIQIQAEKRKERFRFQNVEEESFMVGEKKDGRIVLHGADEDEHARYFD